MNDLKSENNNQLSEEWYKELVEECKAIIVEKNYNANCEFVEAKWLIGQRITTDPNFIKIQGQHNKKSFLQRIFLDLRIGKSDGYYCVQFYEKHPEEDFSNVLEKLKIGKNLSWRKIIALLPEHIEDPIIISDELKANFKDKVIQGDCLIELKRIPDKSIDMIYVDPPYNMDKGDWDKFDPVDFLHFTDSWIKECIRVLKPQSHFFINFCSDKVSWLEDLIMTNFNGMLPYSRLIWHYRNAGGKSSGKQMFSKTYEPILHYNFGNKELNFGLDWNDERFDVWTIAIPQSNFEEGHDHPTQKPIELMDRLIRFGSFEGEKVLDPMAGSGTTGIAALKNNRDFMLIEKDTNYINLIHKRLNDIR